MTTSSDRPELDDDSLQAIPGEPESVKKMSLGEIFSSSWEIYKSHPVIVVPSLIPVLWLILGMMFLVAGFAGWAMFGDPSGFAAFSMMGWMMLFLIVLAVSFIVAQGLSIEMIRNAWLGQPVDLGRAWEASKSKMGSLIAASLLAGILTALGYMLLIVPGLILTAMLYFVAQAVMIDNRGAVDSLGVSYRFVRANLEDAVVIIIISMAIGLMLAAVPGIGPFLSLFAMPYIYALATLLYMDRKPR